jgi:hypothetical protein
MQYMLLIIADETKAPLPATELSKVVQAYQDFTADIVESGHFRAGAPLQPASRATTVREKNGQRLITDGPFAESREHLAGYYLVECEHLDEAIAIAGRIPCVRYGEAVEIRPLMPTPTAVPAS